MKPMTMKTIKKYSLLGLTTFALLAGAGIASAADRDDKVEQAFKDSYVYRTQLKDTDLKIDSDDGIVTLKGKVDSDDQKRLAEDTVRGLPGVVQIKNEVRVANEPKEASDDWIAAKVRGALLFHRNVSLVDTKVSVNNGIVTLTGTAESDAEKSLAAEYASDVKGVKRVANDIKIVEKAAARSDKGMTSDHPAKDNWTSTSDRTTGNKIDDASITAQLKYALSVRKSTSALRTEVKTENGVVSIHGTAKNSAEKDLVTKLAEGIDGVRDVKNEMTVQGGY